MRILVISAVVTAASACGPGAKIGGGKQGAAEALYATSTPTKPAGDTLSSGIDLPREFKIKCPEGGSAQLTDFHPVVRISDYEFGAGQGFIAQLHHCGAANSHFGVAELNGDMNVKQSVVFGHREGKTYAAIRQRLNGRVDVRGAFDDFLEADIVQYIEAAAFANKGAQVEMTLKGTIETSSGRYSFDETVKVTAGELNAEIVSGR
jgi:hypothetical protein